jgi:hypothetical protein
MLQDLAALPSGNEPTASIVQKAGLALEPAWIAL